MQKSISHAVMVALCGLGIVILGAVATAVTNYHAQGFVANLVCNSVTPLLTAACAGAIHFLTTQEAS